MQSGRYVCRYKSLDPANFKGYLDDQELTEIDTVISEFDVSLKRLGLVILEQFFKRNFQLTHTIFQNFLKEMVENEFTNNVNPHIYDNILASMGLLPSVYKTISKTNSNQQIKYVLPIIVIDHLKYKTFLIVIFLQLTL